MNEKNSLQLHKLPEEDLCWRAVEIRDPAYEGNLYYGVRSTGIYCRPTCPSRRPRRNQVAFFPTWQAAEAAGFRACQRCQPRAEHRPAVEMVRQAQRILEAADAPLSLDELSRRLGVSPYHLQRTFKSITGLSPRQYAAALRALRLKDQLQRGEEVTRALYEAGYGSSSRLYENAAGDLGMTPAVYRRGGAGMQIYYRVTNSDLGWLLLAATERGICTITMGDDPGRVVEMLEQRFPAARCVDAAQASDSNASISIRLEAWLDALRNYLSGSLRQLDLPLDVQGTAFQRKVWDELRRIPYGEKRTYTQVAEAIGNPAAVRAVARACATNPTALVVPCHRVVRSDGSLAGYRWGLPRKKQLLEREQR